MINILPHRITVLTAILLIAASAICPEITGQTKSAVTEYNTLIKVENNSLITEVSYLIKVTDKQSEWLSDISIPYKKSEKIEIVEGLVLNSLGAVVRRLLKKEIVTRSDISAGSLFEDNYVKEFNLRWHEYPYSIKYTYRTTSKDFIYISVWSPVISPIISTLKASLEVRLPAGFNFKTHTSGKLRFTSDSTEKTKVLSWEAENIPPFNKETFSPHYLDILPTVYVMPESFFYGIPGKLDSWESFGKWQHDINNQLGSLPYQERSRVDSIISGAEDKREIIRRLYHYLQDNTRYINVSINIGGLVPYPASYVCTNKYGDCKALTIYMMAMLKYAGIESYYTIIRSGENAAGIIKDFPAPQFNHVFLCVPLGNDTIWLENTDNLSPVGYLSTFTQNRYALLVNGTKSQLVKTPTLSSADVKVRSIYMFKPEESGRSKILYTSEMTGPEFERALEIFNEKNDQARKSYLKSMVNPYCEVISYRLDHQGRDDRMLTLNSELELPNVLKKIGDDLVFSFSPLRFGNLEKPETRIYPLKINYPVNQIDSVVLDLSSFNAYRSLLPPDSFFSAEYGSYSLKYQRNGDLITATSQFQLYPNYYDRDKYKGFYDFLESVKTSIRKSSIILTRKK